MSITDIPIQERLRDWKPIEIERVELTDHDVRITNFGQNAPKDLRHVFVEVEFRRDPKGIWEKMLGVTAVTARMNVKGVFEFTAWVHPGRYNGPKDWITRQVVVSGPKV